MSMSPPFISTKMARAENTAKPRRIFHMVRVSCAQSWA
jgi:hypothetical protein